MINSVFIFMFIFCQVFAHAADMSKNRKLVPAFYSLSPTHIKYCPRPVRSGDAVTELRTDDFSARYQFTWTDGILVDESIRDGVWADRSFPKTANEAVEERLHKPLTNLVVCDMGPVGKGVFLALDSEPLPIGTVIGIYAGRLQRYSDTNDKEYSMTAQEDEHRASAVHQLIKCPALTAKNHGNIVRFIQDLPSAGQDLTNIENCSDHELENIATENLARMSCTHKGFPITYIFTIREIQPGEQLGFPYEEAYWQNKNFDRALFDIDGNIIGHLKKNRTITWLDTFNPSPEKIAPVFNCEIAQPIVSPMLNNKNSNGFDFELRFVADVKACLTAFKDRSCLSIEVQNNLSTLESSFDQAITSDEKFLILNKVLKSETKIPGDTRKELILHMNTYNEGKLKLQRSKNTH